MSGERSWWSTTRCATTECPWGKGRFRFVPVKEITPQAAWGQISAFLAPTVGGRLVAEVSVEPAEREFDVFASVLSAADRALLIIVNESDAPVRSVSVKLRTGAPIPPLRLIAAAGARLQTKPVDGGTQLDLQDLDTYALIGLDAPLRR